MKTKIKKTKTPNWKLRRLAPRALRSLTRHSGSDEALQAFKDTLGPAAEAFSSVYDALGPAEATRSKELGEARVAMERLRRAVQPWVSYVEATGTLPGFDPGRYRDAGTVPDDVITDAKSLIQLVEGRKAQDPTSMPLADKLIGALSPLVAEAEKAWAEAEGAKVAHQQLTEEVREHAARLATMLVGYRRSLLSTVGRGHPDYQALRASKVDRAEDDGVEAEGPAEPGSVVDMQQAG